MSFLTKLFGKRKQEIQVPVEWDPSEASKLIDYVRTTPIMKALLNYGPHLEMVRSDIYKAILTARDKPNYKEFDGSIAALLVLLHDTHPAEFRNNARRRLGREGTFPFSDAVLAELLRQDYAEMSEEDEGIHV